MMHFTCQSAFTLLLSVCGTSRFNNLKFTKFEKNSKKLIIYQESKINYELTWVNTDELIG
jgi:hypothetical protein